MASPLSAFSSPLGPMHFAPPSSMSIYSLASLFRTPKASISSPSAPKRPKKSTKTKQSLQISSPIISTFQSTYQNYCEGANHPSPPPSYRRDEQMGIEEDLEYAEEVEEEDEQLSRKEKLSIEEMERRLEQWEQGRMDKKRSKVVEQDRRMGEELESMGL